MKFLLCLLACFSVKANAAVTAGFAGATARISILDYTPAGQRDDDPHRLFSLMDLPITQEAGFGLGKTLRSEDGLLTINCGVGMQGHKSCSLFVKTGSWAQVSPERGTVKYVAYGSDAAALARALFQQPEGSFDTSDGRLQIQAWGGFFLLLFQK